MVRSLACMPTTDHSAGSRQSSLNAQRHLTPLASPQSSTSDLAAAPPQTSQRHPSPRKYDDSHPSPRCCSGPSRSLPASSI
eukprot:3162741-Pleurochrysis_carterae.AAC.1